MTVRFNLGSTETRELREQGFTFVRGFYTKQIGDLLKQVEEHLAFLHDRLFPLGLAFVRAKERAGNQLLQPLLAELIAVTGELAHAQLDSLPNLDDPVPVTDYRYLRENVFELFGTPLGDLAKSILRQIVSRTHDTYLHDIQVRHVHQRRWVSPVGSPIDPWNEVGWHFDGFGVVAREKSFAEVSTFKALLGLYLQDVNADYGKEQRGQLVVVPGSPRTVIGLFKQHRNTLQQLKDRFDAETDTQKKHERFKELEASFHNLVRVPAREMYKTQGAVTVKAVPGDLLIAHPLIVHGHGVARDAVNPINPPGRPAIYTRWGKYDPAVKGLNGALIDPDAAIDLS